MSEIFISLHYNTIDHLARHITMDLAASTSIQRKEIDVVEPLIVRAIREYFEDYDVQGVLRNERPEKRFRAPFREVR